MRDLTKDIYTFNELNEEAKKVAIAVQRANEYYLAYGWYDSITEDFKTILELLGFYDIETSFSGFWSQGDGARFTGNYSNEKRITTKIKGYAPKDAELNRIAKDIMAIQQINKYKLEATIEANTHRYLHSNTMSVNTFNSENEYTDIKQYEEFEQLCKDLADWYYDRLENYYDYLMTDKVVAEHLICNEVKFNTDGTRC